MKPKGVLASYATILGSLHSKRTPIPIRKNVERLPIVACVKAAETRLLSLGKIKTLGLIFRHETRFNEAAAVLCYYIRKSTSKTYTHPLT